MALGRNRRGDGNARAPRTRGVLLDRLRHIDLVKAQHASAHHAILELLGDGVGWVKETLHAFNQPSVCSGVNRCITWRHNRSGFVQFLLRLQQNQRGRWGRAWRADRCVDVLVRIGNVSVDAGGQLRDTRLEHALCEVIQLHRQFGTGEVNTNVLLGRNGQRGELLVIVLHLQSGTVSHQCAIRQANTQGRTDLGTFNSKAVIVLTVYVAGKDEVVF